MDLMRMVLGPLGTNCYIVWHKNDAAVIDPGFSGEKVADWLDSKQLKLRSILLTHSHFDHIGGVKALKKRFPDAKVVIGRTEEPYLLNKNRTASFHVDPGAYTGLYADHTVVEGDEIKAGDIIFSVLDTPGHTAGGVCYICGEWIFSGDTLFCLEVGRTDLEGGDYATLLKSLAKIAALKGDYRVYPGHEGETTLEFEKNNNPYVLQALGCAQ
jgi:hydroxyacylglutathione hydrolase